MKRSLVGVSMGVASMFVVGAAAQAEDLTLPNGGQVSIELVFSDAAFHNTMSVVSPTTGVAVSGCQIEPSTGLPGIPAVSEKPSQRGCRVQLDADPATPGIQGFVPGTVLSFALCAQTNADPACDFIWSSTAKNSDSFEHLRTTPIHAAQFPGQIFQLAWEDEQNGGDQDFNDLVATVRVSNDADGDGLWDDWETFGIDTNGDGIVDLDLPALGASPNHKDLFIHVDYMDCSVAGGDCPAGDTHSHQPKQAAINAAIAAFANAPVTNPDGTQGINMHVEIGAAVAHQQFLFLPGGCFSGGPGVGSFDDVKAANFPVADARRFAYHYNVWGHLQDPSSSSSGCGELPGNDFLVTLGGFNLGGPNDIDGDGLADPQLGTISQQAGTLVHELGHNLSLQHGGGDGTNFKPNFISLMNYWFQLGGIPPVDPDGAGPLAGRLDYSSATLATLSETALSEAAGVGAGTNNSLFFCPSSVGGSGTIVGNGPADWNCSGATDPGTVSSDVNQDSLIGTLPGFNDWPTVLLRFQATTAFDDGSPFLRHAQPEIDVPQYERFVRPNLSVSESASPPVVSAGGTVTFTTVVKNRNPEGARDLQVAIIVPGGLTVVSCTATSTSTSAGTCTSAAGGLTASFKSLPGTTNATITIVGQANCADSNGAQLITSVQAAHSRADADPGDDQAAASVTVANPPPTFTFVPPAITITTCVGANIGMAKATAVCGTPAITNNAPAKFPLGKTTVTWTATDAGGSRATATQVVTAVLGDSSTCCPVGTNIIIGTSNNDNLVGTAGSDCILGLGAQDNISGGDGNDFISGGDGDDIISGGDGDDIIYGGSGQDHLSGGNGNDQLFGGDGDDTLDGGPGSNICDGGQGQNHLTSCQ